MLRVRTCKLYSLMCCRVLAHQHLLNLLEERLSFCPALHWKKTIYFGILGARALSSVYAVFFFTPMSIRGIEIRELKLLYSECLPFSVCVILEMEPRALNMLASALLIAICSWGVGQAYWGYCTGCKLDWLALLFVCYLLVSEGGLTL